MFTGIVAACEEVNKIEEHNGNLFFTIGKPSDWQLEVGESVLVNGVCSTVLTSAKNEFTVEYMPETLRLTAMDAVETGTPMNLERSMQTTDLLSGYLVYGHIDAMGTITAIEDDGDSHIVTIEHPKEYDRYMISKGAIVINGIALTVINPQEGQFQVAIIPHTWDMTHLHSAAKGDSVNLEYDVIAKYIEKIHGPARNQ